METFAPLAFAPDFPVLVSMAPNGPVFFNANISETWPPNKNGGSRSYRQHDPYATQPSFGVDNMAEAGWTVPATNLHPTGGRHAVQGVSLQEVASHTGQIVDLARTANGSSFLQSALRENADENVVALIWGEIEPQFSDILLDAHGCYVIKTLMECLPPQELRRMMDMIAVDEQLVFSMCTHSLHTRRVVQFLLEAVDCPYIFLVLTKHCAEIATTQQGCIVMQRAMDVAKEPNKAGLFAMILSRIVDFSTDPFANYVVQHLLEVGNREQNSTVIAAAFKNRVVELSCNKFASNVMEKALFHVTPDVQHEILMEMYGGGEEVLYKMLQDSFGNYIIQSSIALAAFKDVSYMSDKLRPVLTRTPYGHKIDARLDRRLRGKPVGTRSPATGNPQPFNSGRGGYGGRRGRGGFRGRGHYNGYSHAAADVAQDDEKLEEEPW